jgi:hypothetical protein
VLRTDRTPSIAAVQDKTPSPYSISILPQKLFIAWVIDNQVVMRRLYLDTGCAPAQTFFGFENDPSPPVPQAGIQSGAGPRLTTMDVEPPGGGPAYKALLLFTRDVQPGSSYRSVKMVDRTGDPGFP